MLTVVAKLLQIAAPNHAYFGEKDYQQLTLIRQMVWDLNFDVQIIGVPTVREFDGLALSSRNRYLDENQRAAAVALSAALIAGAHAAAGGSGSNPGNRTRCSGSCSGNRGRLPRGSGRRSGPPAPERGDGRLLVAAKLGTTRLIDNVGVAVGTGFLERDTDHPPTPSTTCCLTEHFSRVRTWICFAR